MGTCSMSWLICCACLMGAYTGTAGRVLPALQRTASCVAWPNVCDRSQTMVRIYRASVVVCMCALCGCMAVSMRSSFLGVVNVRRRLHVHVFGRGTSRTLKKPNSNSSNNKACAQGVNRCQCGRGALSVLYCLGHAVGCGVGAGQTKMETHPDGAGMGRKGLAHTIVLHDVRPRSASN